MDHTRFPIPSARLKPSTGRRLGHHWTALLLIFLLFNPMIIDSAEATKKEAGNPDQLVVMLKAGVSEKKAEKIFKLDGAEIIDRLEVLNSYLVQVDGTKQDSILEKLAKRFEVETVELNLAFAPDQVPNDPLYGSQWHLPHIGAEQAWEITQGAPAVMVAVVDSGIDPQHPELADRLVGGWNFFNSNPDTSDVFGHGTKVAGVISAVSNNLVGVASLSWNNPLMPIRVTDPMGNADAWALAQAITWSVDHGAKVINVSFGGITESSVIRQAAEYATIRGAVVVASAGNTGVVETAPETPFIVSVGATDADDVLTYFSSRGEFVDLSAPGVDILTTLMPQVPGMYFDAYGHATGTSFAAPIVSGVVALMRAANPELLSYEVIEMLEATALDLGDVGYDVGYGHGRVDAFAAVEAAYNSTLPPPDVTPPEAVIDHPLEAAEVGETIVVAVSATDDTGVVRVDLYVDDTPLASDFTFPYEFSWDTTESVNGTHTLKAVAVDAAENEGESTEITVNVANVEPDLTAPTAVIITPADGGIFTKKVIVKVVAKDNVQVSRIDLYVDGALFQSTACTSNVCRQRIALKKTVVGSGGHSLQATAYDTSGNTASSPMVNIQLN